MMHFLNLPIEVRLRIYDYLFINREVQIEPDHPNEFGDGTFSIKPVPMSAQLIRTCRAIHDEAQQKLYTSNVFNCSQREGLKLFSSLFLQNIGRKNFSLVRHIIIDWEQLQDFAWSLAKEDYGRDTRGLRVVELATWRMRVLGGSSFLWREVKSYERQLCQSASEICQKHMTLKVIAQRAYHKSGRLGATNAPRVKWRFVPSEQDAYESEVIVPIEAELEQLRVGQDSDDQDRNVLRMIDPF